MLVVERELGRSGRRLAFPDIVFRLKRAILFYIFMRSYLLFSIVPKLFTQAQEKEDKRVRPSSLQQPACSSQHPSFRS
jgi:hypothetical protein